MIKQDRTVDVSIEIDASTERVWQAVSTGEMSRWFPPEARVTPGQGGSVWMSWGGGMEGEAPIEVWEPNRHLRVGGYAVVDYFIEKKGSVTVFRVVQSGFDGEGWEEHYDGTLGGWTYFLYNLKFYLEKHRDEERHLMSVRWPMSVTREEAWPLLLGSRGLDLQPASAQPGTPFQIKLADATLHGQLEQLRIARNLAATVNELSGLLFIEFEGGSPGWNCGIWLSAYGERPDVESYKARLERVMTKLFPRAAEVPA